MLDSFFTCLTSRCVGYGFWFTLSTKFNADPRCVDLFVWYQKKENHTVYLETSKYKSIQSMSLPGPYYVVQVFEPEKLIQPVSVEENVPLPVEIVSPWIIHGVTVGCYRPASILKTLPGLDGLEQSRLDGKRIRQLNSGKFVLSDVAAAVLFENPKNAGQWANYEKHRSVAPSLTSIESGHVNVSLLRVDHIFFFINLYPARAHGHSFNPTGFV